MTEQYTPDLSSAQSYYVSGRAQLRRQITGEQAIDVTEYSHEFDRWLAEVRREAAEKALTDLARKIEATSKRTDNTFTEHAVVEAGGLELLREAAEAYRQEREER